MAQVFNRRSHLFTLNSTSFAILHNRTASQMQSPVYVLGRTRGALSHLVTHELARLPEQPQVPRIVYLLRSENQLRSFLNHDSTLTINQHSVKSALNTSHTQLMSACAPPQYDNGDMAHIDSMICSFNRIKDVTELHRYKQSLTADSSLLLLESDKSYVDSLRNLVWKDQNTRPQLYQALSQHKAWSFKDFESSIIGSGSLIIAKIPRDPLDLDAYEYDLAQNYKQDGELMDMLHRAKGLNTVFVKYTDFAHAQYEFMIIKTVLGSLTALYDCSNGELLKMKNSASLMKAGISECLRIIERADPMSFNAPNATVALNTDRLLDVSFSLMKSTERQSSLLRQQVGKWDPTEVKNTTGYFAYLARQHRVGSIVLTTWNRMLEGKISLGSLRGGRVVIDDDF